MEAFASKEIHGSLVRFHVAWLALALACLRLCHIHLLWADEDYHLAAAIHMLHGKVPYRDFWYDKPPLCAAFYLLVAGYPGWPLRILDAGYIVTACYLAYLLARDWWGELEGRVAALLLAFFTAFYLPSAVIPLAADALMMIPHFAAIYCARRKLALWAGIWVGVGFFFNTKALFILATCAILLFSQLPLLLIGFTLPLAAGLLFHSTLAAARHRCLTRYRAGLASLSQARWCAPRRIAAGSVNPIRPPLRATRARQPAAS
jgi:4-amino-4-deoxy-L-arabinose transferase-like glycosyltransferase